MGANFIKKRTSPKAREHKRPRTLLNFHDERSVVIKEVWGQFLVSDKLPSVQNDRFFISNLRIPHKNIISQAKIDVNTYTKKKRGKAPRQQTIYVTHARCLLYKNIIPKSIFLPVFLSTICPPCIKYRKTQKNTKKHKNIKNKQYLAKIQT